MRTVMLTDGPHQLEVPKVPQLIELQGMGYRIGDMFGPALFVPNGDEFDANLKAIADHLCVLLRVTEPHADWTPEKVAEVMSLADAPDYFTLLNDLGNEGFSEPDPKASKPD